FTGRKALRSSAATTARTISPTTRRSIPTTGMPCTTGCGFRSWPARVRKARGPRIFWSCTNDASGLWRVMVSETRTLERPGWARCVRSRALRTGGVQRMSARVLDELLDHPKLAVAGQRLGKNGGAIALGFYVAALLWCNRQLTDGVI